MNQSKIYVGLEIGTSKICFVVGESRPDASLKILGIGQTRSVGVKKGEIFDYPLVRSALNDALNKAEECCDVDINSVLLAITGKHIKAINNTGTLRLPDNDPEVDQSHIDEAIHLACDVPIPSNNAIIHKFIKHYRIDQQEHNVVPIGLTGKSLEIDFHIIHGIKSRIENCIKCVTEIPLDVDNFIFSPIASAQVALTLEDKDSGALIIDIGCGTTDYALYINGALEASGSIPVGGYHVSNDIHVGIHIPFSQAESLKKNEGDASGDPAKGVGKAKVLDDRNYEVGEIERSYLNYIIHARLSETLQLVKKNLPQKSLSKIGTGVFITGGTSRMRGLSELAESIFNLPVYKVEEDNEDGLSGENVNFRAPEYTTAVGLIRYAQILDAHQKENEKNGKISKIFKSLWPFG